MVCNTDMPEHRRGTDLFKLFKHEKSVYGFHPNVGHVKILKENVLLQNLWANKMAQQVKGLAAKADDLSLIPGTHMVKGDSWFV